MITKRQETGPVNYETKMFGFMGRVYQNCGILVNYTKTSIVLSLFAEIRNSSLDWIRLLNKSTVKAKTGWWYTYPSEKY